MAGTTASIGAHGHHQSLGRYGETLAARHLVEQWMVLLDRNWRCPTGKIDLVLRDGDVLVVCEVETRSSHDYGIPHEAVTPDKVSRLRRLAAAWLTAHAAQPAEVRLDLVAILRPRRGPSALEHVRGWADAGRNHPHRVAPGGDGPPDRRAGRRVPGPRRHHRGRSCRHLPPRGTEPVPDDRAPQRLPLARHPPGHHPAVTGRPAQDRHSLRPGRSRRRSRRQTSPRATANATHPAPQSPDRR